MEKSKEYYMQSELIENGITKTIISKFLKEPCMTAKNRNNSKYPIKLYSIERVNSLYNNLDFINEMNKSKNRKIIANKATNTKIEKTLKEYENFNIVVKKEKGVVLKAINSYNDFNFENPIAHVNSDETFLQRITVNYIRHNLTKYDNVIESLFSKVGRGEVYRSLNIKIYEEISNIYPEYKNECKNQLNKKLEELKWKS
jgi:hypothetical protein